MERAQIDLTRREIRCGRRTHRLTPMEHRLMSWFVRHPGELFSPEDLLRQVWGYHPRVQSRTVYTTIQRLRAKLEPNPRRPRLLISVYGVGYRYEPARAA